MGTYWARNVGPNRKKRRRKESETKLKQNRKEGGRGHTGLEMLAKWCGDADEHCVSLAEQPHVRSCREGLTAVCVCVCVCVRVCVCVCVRACERDCLASCLSHKCAWTSAGEREGERTRMPMGGGWAGLPMRTCACMHARPTSAMRPRRVGETVRARGLRVRAGSSAWHLSARCRKRASASCRCSR